MSLSSRVLLSPSTNRIIRLPLVWQLNTPIRTYSFPGTEALSRLQVELLRSEFGHGWSQQKSEVASCHHHQSARPQGRRSSATRQATGTEATPQVGGDALERVEWGARVWEWEMRAWQGGLQVLAINENWMRTVLKGSTFRNVEIT